MDEKLKQFQTKKWQDAIDKALKIWEYMAKTGGDNKKEAYEALELDEDAIDCPFCQAVDLDGCDGCIWTAITGNDCCHDESPFENWDNSKRVGDRKYWAAQVCKLIKTFKEATKMDENNSTVATSHDVTDTLNLEWSIKPDYHHGGVVLIATNMETGENALVVTVDKNLKLRKRNAIDVALPSFPTGDDGRIMEAD